MRLDGLTIALRPRSPWEATDLGVALVRAHAGRIYAAWVLTTLPVFLLLNAAAYLLGSMWIAALAMWWLKPAFDRVPLFVLSRAVFGELPSRRETLRAQRNWGWRGIAPWLLWRRLHPGRAMLLAVDLLEGVTGAQRRERVSVLVRAGGSPNVMLTIIGMHLEAMLSFSIVLFALMFVPTEFLSDSAKVVWDKLVENPPLWAQALLNFVFWLAMSVIEPVFIGAGFGLYLNRRMQLEGWDIELNFRRIAARLSPLASALAALLLVVVATFASAPAAAESTTEDTAQERSVPQKGVAAESSSESSADERWIGSGAEVNGTKGDAANVESLRSIFAAHYRADGADFETSVKKAFADADLSPKIKQWVWEPREHRAPKKQELSAGGRLFGSIMGFIAKFGLWIAFVVLLAVVIANHRRWLPWISERFANAPAPDRIGLHEIAAPDALPGDVAAAVRRLWQQGKPRPALALLYRAGVARLADTLGAPLPPGATESECLRQSRRLRDQPYASLFARIVRCWQAAAYAQRLPPALEVEALLSEWNTTREASA